MNRVITIVSTLAIIGNAAIADPVRTETARNRHNYTLKLDLYNFVNGGWRGDANFSISACPQAACFRLSGSISLPINPSTGLNEGSFQVARLPCDLHFREVPRNGMDSGDWRVTLSSRDHSGKGCASLPASLTGVYRQVD
jgi:hypothetical protein